MKSIRNSNLPRATDVVRDPRWAAVVARDASRDAEFVYAVTTTGVYGRASSAS